MSCKQENQGDWEEKCDLQQSGLSKLRKRWKESSPEDRFKKIAWSVATSCAIETREQAIDIYEKLMSDRLPSKDESNKTC